MDHLVITVHGIRTFGDWQGRLEKEILAKSRSPITVHHFVYGYFSMMGFIIPFTRWLLVRRFKRELIDLVKRSKPSRIDIVAHSFGTHLVSWALRDLPADLKLQVNTLILAGSVLRSDFYWADLMPGRVTRVINDCGASDVALIASQFLVPLTGMAGRTGFVGMTGPEFCNRYSLFGHSGYFTDDAGKPADEYMSRAWVPLLLGSDPVEAFDRRNAPTPWRGLTIWLSNNFEPIKLAFLLSPVIAALIWVGALYIEANAAKERITSVVDLAEIMKSKGELAGTSSSLLATMQQALNVPLQRTYGLWVDDEPRRNVQERRILGTLGFCFVLEKNTFDAMRRLTDDPQKYSVIVSDFRRDSDPAAGYGLFDSMRKSEISTPFVFYVANFTNVQRQEAIAKGVSDEVTGAVPLLQALVNAVRPNAETPS